MIATRGKLLGLLLLGLAAGCGDSNGPNPAPASTPPTARPTSRKGRRISQTIGYTTTARSASGQHRTSKIIQRKNLVISGKYENRPGGGSLDCQLFLTTWSLKLR
jgi:hypothetical protein